MSQVKQDSAVFLSKVPNTIAELETASKKWNGMGVTLEAFGRDSEAPNVAKVCTDLVNIGETVIKTNVENLKNGFIELEGIVRKIATTGGEI